MITFLDKMHNSVCKPKGYCVYRKAEQIGKELWKFIYVKKEELNKGEVSECYFCDRKSE
ncbi:MAG: hypothetical protein ACSHXA_07440 [Polaribacter sp.]|uniref:hypothetical protein n=1 Tax=Polaribacter sp. TaxID=1920175 RepID=UPI003EF51EA7